MTEPKVWPEHISEAQQGFHCEACDEYSDVEGDDPLYECSAGDGVFNGQDGNRCPQCNKFGSRVGQACANCGEGPLEEEQVFHCTIDDAFYLDGDQEDHLHEEDEEEQAEAEPGKPRRLPKSPWPVPILTTKRAADVVAGDVLARPWKLGSTAAIDAASGKGPLYQEDTVDFIEAPAGYVYLFAGTRSSRIGLAGYASDEQVQIITGWDRPTGAIEIAPKDLTIDHIVFPDPSNWRRRKAYVEIRHDLGTGQVSANVRGGEPDVYAPDDTIVVAKGNKYLSDPGWTVEWDRPFLRMREDPALWEALYAALEEIGAVEGRKLWLFGYSEHPSLTHKSKRPDLALKFIEVLHRFGYQPLALIQKLV